MPFIATTIELTDQIRKILVSFSNSRSLPLHQVQRSKIIILAADGLNNNEISSRVGLSQDTVSKWRMRFSHALPRLEEIGVLDPSKLQDEITSVLKDAARPGHPHKYTQEQIIHIQEMACRPPEEYGFEISHWSLNKLRAAIIQEGIVDDIPVGTVSYFLK